jgi:large-conductance mechanosensitive channel
MNKLKFKLNNKKSTYFGYKKVIIASLGIFIVATVFLAVESSTVGSKLSYLEEQEEKLTNERRSLTEQLNNHNSLTTISAKALELGFSSPQNIIYPSKEGVVANVR